MKEGTFFRAVYLIRIDRRAPQSSEAALKEEANLMFPFLFQIFFVRIWLIFHAVANRIEYQGSSDLGRLGLFLLLGSAFHSLVEISALSTEYTFHSP